MTKIAKPTLKSQTPKHNTPIAYKKLKANGIYAVKYALPAELAAEYGVVQEQRGIVVLDSMKNVALNWNIDRHMDWSYQIPTDLDMQSLAYFSSYTIERQFAGLKLSSDEYANVQAGILRREQNARLEQQIVFDHIMAHPLHRLASWLIKLF